MRKNYFCVKFIFLFTFITTLNKGTAFERIKFLICADNARGIPGEKSATSDVSVYENKNVVRKQVKDYLQYDVFNREVETLMALNNFSHVPKILAVDFDNKTFYMEYGGEPLTKKNLPADWPRQIKNIIDGLRKRGIQHNDIKNAELLVKNGKIMLIDYGWASEYGKPIDPSWPSGLGGRYKAPWGFDDRYSIIFAVMTAQADGKNPTKREVEEKIKQIFGNNDFSAAPVEYTIIKAQYGNDDKQKDVTENLKKATKETSFDFEGGNQSFNSLFTDPAPGAKKTLSIEYKDQTGTHTKKIQEDQAFILP